MPTLMLAAALLLFAPVSFAGENCAFTLPLHAVVEPGAPCLPTAAPDCHNLYPTVNVSANARCRIYLFVANAEAVSSIQTAFTWPSTWDLLDAQWDCQPGQVAINVPDPNSSTGGPFEGALTSTFDCVTSPPMILVGQMDFQAGSSGCLTQVIPALPFGIHVVNCTGGLDTGNGPSYTPRLGAVCVGSGGEAACSPVVSPPPACICIAGGPYVGRVGVPVEFNGGWSYCYQPMQFHWDFGDGATTATQYATHVYENSGVYTVRFTVFEFGRCPDLPTYCETTATIEATAGVELPSESLQIRQSTWGGVKTQRRTP